MSDLLVPLALLACPVGMVLMMLFMGRGMFGGSARQKAAAGPSDDLAAMKAEAAELDGRIELLESRRAEPAER